MSELRQQPDTQRDLFKGPPVNPGDGVGIWDTKRFPLVRPTGVFDLSVLDVAPPTIPLVFTELSGTGQGDTPRFDVHGRPVYDEVQPQLGSVRFPMRIARTIVGIVPNLKKHPLS